MLRSAHDREILRLAVPALGALGVVLALICVALADPRWLAGSMLLAGVGLYVRSRCSRCTWTGASPVWAGLLAFVFARLVTIGARFPRGGWAVTGAAVARG